MDITCPKCRHVREPDTQAPDWQCPSCGVAYNKVGAEREPPRQRRSNEEQAASQYQPATDDFRDDRGWLDVLAGFLRDDDDEDYDRRKKWSWGWFFVTITVVAIIAVSQRGQLNSVDGSAMPNTSPTMGMSGPKRYNADYERAMSLRKRWATAIQQAEKAAMDQRPGSGETAEYRKALQRLSTFQHEWNSLVFETDCYRRTRTIFADALLTSREHVEAYATAEVMPTDEAADQLFQRYAKELNFCLPSSARHWY